jgi:hypothetical protein
VNGIDYCSLASAAFDIATIASGVCYSCLSTTGAPAGCAVSCPGCVNAMDNYLAACAGNFTALNY